MERSRSRGSARLVLLTLAYHADKETFISWPSIATIARESGKLSERRVFELLADLCRLGELSISGGGGRGHTSRYQILLPSEGAETLRKSGETLRDCAPFEAEKTLRNSGERVRNSVETLRDCGETLRNLAVTYKAEPTREPTEEPTGEPLGSVCVWPHASVGQGADTHTPDQPPAETSRGESADTSHQRRNVKTPLGTPESWSGTPGASPVQPVWAVLNERFHGFAATINEDLQAVMVREITDFELWRYVVTVYWSGPPHAVNMLRRYHAEAARKGQAGGGEYAASSRNANNYGNGNAKPTRAEVIGQRNYDIWDAPIVGSGPGAGRSD
jgi:hypothetical protein